MGSFPSQEQAVHPSGGLSDTDAIAATHHQHHVQTRMRTRHTLIKKLTRGKLLFLGLDGAGKSTIIHHLIQSLDEERTNIHSTSIAGDAMSGGDDHRGSRVYPNPSKAHQSWSYRLEGDCYLQVLDVPGRREFRRKWYTTAPAPSDSISALYSSVPGSGGGSSQTLPLLGIVFVVDASDRVRFPIVAEELIRFHKLKEQKKTFQRTQFFLLLNKTDKMTAAATSTGSQSNIELQKQANEAEQRAAMRFARRELKKCVDHQLRVDQKRNPHDYRHSSSSAPGSYKQLFVLITRTRDPAWCATEYQVAESANRWHKSSHSDRGSERNPNNCDDDVDHGVQRARPGEHQSHSRVGQGGDQESDVATSETKAFVRGHEP